MATTIGRGANGDQLLAFGVLLGRSAKIIESEIAGSSMGSTLPPGSRIRIRPLSFSEYRAGQVVAFVSGDRIFAHRIIFRGREGVLTRGDNHFCCDLPVPSRAILGEVTEYLLGGEWRSLDERGVSEDEKKKAKSTIEFLLCLCMQVDIRAARYVSKVLIRLARWYRRLTTGPVRTT